MAELFDSLPTGPILRTFMKYSITASGVVSGTFKKLPIVHKVVKIGDPQFEKFDSEPAGTALSPEFFL